jgi:hypothetical protein
VVVRVPTRRFGAAAGPRVVAGAVPDVVAVREGPLAFAASPKAGQKTGAFLDLRGLRRWVREARLDGARVLNLFAYTGMIGRAAEHAGAAVITQVDRDGARWPSPPLTTSASPRAIASSPPTSSRTCPRPPSPTSWSSSIRRR